jgi:hypothetical protein
MTRDSPDDLVSVAHAPLTLPPDYNVRPTEPGAASPPAGTDPGQGQLPLSADDGGTAQSAGEVALLQNAGAAGIDPGIRAQIDTETSALVERDPDLISRLVLGGTAAPEGQTGIITTRKQGIF